MILAEAAPPPPYFFSRTYYVNGKTYQLTVFTTANGASPVSTFPGKPIMTPGFGRYHMFISVSSSVTIQMTITLYDPVTGNEIGSISSYINGDNALSTSTWYEFDFVAIPFTSIQFSASSSVNVTLFLIYENN